MIYRDVLQSPEDFDFSASTLGPCSVPSPIDDRPFVPDDARILFGDDLETTAALVRADRPVPSFEQAGPRERIFFDPSWTKAAIVTCGGLCPGLNDVIKHVVETLWFDYGVRNILGLRYGYRGLVPQLGHAPLELTPDFVDKIHQEGGTVLGSSRGPQDVGVMCDTLARHNIDILFAVGGDGTLRGAHAIAQELRRRGANIAVVGVPKTIDNDLSFVGRSFGFETSVYATADTLTAAHMEAKGALNGIGLVKLMGRDSGFIAAYASLANSVVNFCLIPEVPFTLDGPSGLLAGLERRFASGKDHAVIVVAEGAGQELFADLPTQTDASGNVLKRDIGVFLKERIAAHFKAKGIPCSIKYFDPSYAIRSVPAYGTDSILCALLAQNAVHAAMAGRTDVVIGHNGRHYFHVPIALAVSERQKVDTNGPLWNAVLSATRQNDYLDGD